MTGLVVFVIFAAGWIAGVLTAIWNDSPDLPDDTDVRRSDRW